MDIKRVQFRDLVEKNKKEAEIKGIPLKELLYFPLVESIPIECRWNYALHYHDLVIIWGNLVTRLKRFCDSKAVNIKWDSPEEIQAFHDFVILVHAYQKHGCNSNQFNHDSARLVQDWIDVTGRTTSTLEQYSLIKSDEWNDCNKKLCFIVSKFVENSIL